LILIAQIASVSLIEAEERRQWSGRSVIGRLTVLTKVRGIRGERFRAENDGGTWQILVEQFHARRIQRKNKYT